MNKLCVNICLGCGCFALGWFCLRHARAAPETEVAAAAHEHASPDDASAAWLEGARQRGMAWQPTYLEPLADALDFWEHCNPEPLTVEQFDAAYNELQLQLRIAQSLAASQFEGAEHSIPTHVVQSAVLETTARIAALLRGDYRTSDLDALPTSLRERVFDDWFLSGQLSLGARALIVFRFTRATEPSLLEVKRLLLSTTPAGPSGRVAELFRSASLDPER